MILLDAYAVIAFIADELAAAQVEELLREEPCVITPVNLAEVFDTLTRVRNFSEADVMDQWKALLNAGVVVFHIDEAIGLDAARLRSKYYKKNSCEISLADCMALAAARSAGARVATSDPAVVRVASLEGIGYHPLPSRANLLPGSESSATHLI